MVKQLKKYQKDYEYVTFESNIHGDLQPEVFPLARQYLHRN